MKWVMTLYCLLALASSGALMYAAWSMERATIAMTKMADDNRDIFPRLAAAEERINIERGQMTKDGIRIRELLKKLERKSNGAIKSDPTGPGGAQRNPGHPNHRPTQVP